MPSEAVIAATAATAHNLKKAVIGLTLIYAVGVFCWPPMHYAHWVAMGAYLLILFGGMNGASKRSRGWLRFYWVSQFFLLILTLAAIIFGLTMLIRQMNWSRTHPKEVAEMHPELKNITREQVVRFVIANVLYLLSFLIVLAVKVRSILLAQRLIHELNTAEALELSNEFELEEAVPSDEVYPGAAPIYETYTEDVVAPVEPTPTPTPMPMAGAPQPVFYMAPGAAPGMPFMMPQYVNPGQQFQYMPVYVDQYGNAIPIQSANM